MRPTFGSLFAGIGGLDLGLELAGWQCSWQVETDSRCNWVLGKHWPEVRRYGDIKEIEPGQLEAVDLISAGWPCQDLSVAGKRGGLAAERSGLFFQAIRLIQGLQPQWVLLEQVPGLFSQNKGRDFVLVIQALAECGYGFMWRVLNSQYFGVPQRRRRVFIVGHLRDVARLGQSQSRQDPPRLAGLHPEVLFESESLPRDTAKGGRARAKIAPLLASGAGTSRPAGVASEADYCIAAPLKASSPSRRAGGSWPIAEEFVLPFDTTQITNPSNRSDPKPGDPCHPLSESGHAPAIVQHALSGNNQRNDPDGEHFVVEVSRPLVFGQTIDHHDESQQTYVVGTLSGGQEGGFRTEPGDHLVEAYNWQSGGDVRLSFGKPNLQANQVPAVGVRRLTPTECERLQGFPPTLIWEVSQMSRDEFAIALLASDAVLVNPELGQVFVTRGPGGHQLSKPRKIEGSNCNGYRVASFWLGKARKQLRLHRLIWMAVHGIIPSGQVIHHINRDKADNQIANLESLTCADNSTKAAEDGCYRYGLDNPATKIAPKVARQIAHDYRHARGTMRQLAEHYGISKSRVHQIVHEQGWTEGQADSPRYRQLGNAVTVSVAEWIGKRIAKAHLGQETNRSRDREGGVDNEKDLEINTHR